MNWERSRLTTTSVRGSNSRRAAFRHKIAKAARWLHIYLSMVSFGIILFFAATGLTLNHPDWFAEAVKTRTSKGAVDRALLGAGEPDKNGLVASLRGREHLHGAVDLDEVRVDADEVSFSYKAPGYSADVAVDRRSGTYELTEVRNGFVAVVNDLHKGRDAGKAWGWLIDLSAVLLTLVSFTGLVILWFIYKRRVSGLVLAAAAAAVCVVFYRVFVP
jgi:hypothetical protein